MEEKENVHKGHRERVRTRFENEGLMSFQPHEVLEMLLFYAVPKRDTNELAHRLLDRFGSLDRVFDAELSSLTEVNGVGRNVGVLLKMVPELAQYYMRQRFEKMLHIENSEQMGEYMCARIGMLPREVFAATALDARYNELAFEIIDEGFVSQTTVHIRRLAEFAIVRRAELIVIAHNHVSGDPVPSNSDMETTRRICLGMRQIGVTVADHIIVSGNRYYSFAANGKLPD